MNLFKYSLLATMMSCGVAFGFELLGSGHDLMADGGADSRFVAVWQGGVPFEVVSTAEAINCQGDLVFDGVNIGNVANQQGISAVFAGMGDIVFTLHHQRDGGDWQALNSQRIPCHTGQTLRLKATFYRQTAIATTGTTRSIHKNFSLNDGTNTHAVHLNTNLIFAKPPINHTCHLTSANEQTITLAPIKAQDLERYGKIKGNSLATFHVHCQSANTKIIVMIYDHNNPSNFGTTILTPNHDSTASGVGIELYHHGQAITLQSKPNATPLFFDHASLSVDNGHLSIEAGYVKTGDIDAGTIKAKAGLVFFYP